MKTLRGEIIIFKAPTDEYDKDSKDVYKITLEEAGISASIVPVLTFEFFDLDRLRRKLLCPENYSGLIFTSPRTVRAVALSLEGKTLPDFGWQNAFVVGESTGRVLKRDLKVEGKGSGSGHAAALAEFIIAEMQGTKGSSLPLLYPCGTLSVEPGGDRLGPALALGGLHLDPVPSYRTCPHPGIEECLRVIMDRGLPEMVAFFSPSGVRFAVPVFQKLGIELADLKICRLRQRSALPTGFSSGMVVIWCPWFPQITSGKCEDSSFEWTNSFLFPFKNQIVAIGPTTEAALKTARLPVWATADKPTPQHLTETIIKHL